MRSSSRVWLPLSAVAFAACGQSEQATPPGLSGSEPTSASSSAGGASTATSGAPVASVSASHGQAPSSSAAVTASSPGGTTQPVDSSPTAVPSVAGSGAAPSSATPPTAPPPDAGAPQPSEQLPQPEPDVIVTIHNGGFWNDTSGARIEAHGGGFLQVGDTWYWVGEDKSHNSGNFKAVNVYSSKDLVSWQFENAIITRDTAPELAAADRIIERPKLVYNDSTKKYVMWLHWEGKDYAEAAAGVFTCDSVAGDYQFVKSFRPENNMSRDDQLFKDVDGKAYFMSAANENADMMLYELTDDYLDVKRQVVKLWAGSKREAPAIAHADKYYFITSGATGWDPNQAQYATASGMTSTWSALTNLGDSTTFDTQPTYVIPVKGSKTTTYIYAGDRWQDPDLMSSKYIWLPLKINNGKLALDYYADWQLNLTTGEWSGADDGYLPQNGWTLLSVDSEEIEGEDGAGTNAFDDSTSTFWHSSWNDGDTPPHELLIDLGQVYALTAFRYTPRQDKDDHGMVADYTFYVSESTSDWGTPVAEGTFSSTRASTKVPFAKKNGRYVRFVAQSEINGEQWSSVAELDLEGTAP